MIPARRGRAEGVLLAIDAGGSNTRVVVIDTDGACLGYGVSGSGNPTAVGAHEALRAIRVAVGLALDQARLEADQVDRAVLAAAGEQGLLDDLAVRSGIGTDRAASLDRVLDILAMYHSAAVEPDGIALVAGTGAIAARFSRLRAERVVDGTGWLLGDRGSGFWIGRKVARAVVSHLNGGGPATALTRLVLADLGLPPPEGSGRSSDVPTVLDAFVSKVYADKPVKLARFATLAFRAAPSDGTAAVIVGEAEAALARTLCRVRDGHEELPVVLGGSVLAHGILGDQGRSGGALADALEGADVRWVHDGAAGAAVVGLMLDRVQVSAATLERLHAGIQRVRRA